jgi:hypothetical protein
MHLSTKNFLINVFVLPVIFGCVSTVDIPTEYKKIQLNISGQVSTLPDRNYVYIGSAGAGESMPQPVVFANVFLIDEQGNSFQYTSDAEKSGLYRLQNYAAVAGQKYFIEVTAANGAFYRSVPEKMPESAGVVDARYEIVRRDYVNSEGTVFTSSYCDVFANADFSSDTEPAYLKWNVEEAYLLRPTNFPDPFGYEPPDCFIVQNADPLRVVIMNRTEIKTNQIKDLFVASRIIDNSFYYRHYLTVYQSAISPEAYEYWKKVNVVATQNGSIFDTPPATFKGNLYNVNDPEEIVQGYFQVVNQQFSRFVLVKTDLPVFLPSYCDFDFMRDYDSYPKECYDCLSVRNSSWTRPEWF